MQTDKNKLSETIKTLNIIYLAFLFGQLMLAALIVVLHGNETNVSELNSETNYIINTIALLISIIAIPTGYYLFSQKEKQSQKIDNEDQKIEIFRNATIIKLATFEFAGFVNLIAFFISQSQQSMYIFSIVIVVFFLNKPSKQKFYDSF